MQKINQSRSEAAAFIPTTDWVLVTLGSSFVYEQLEGRVVANCHKVPTDKFTKKLLSAETIKTTLQSTIQLLHKKNPSARIIFTISPVRHLREGFVENNRSKANLITAVHELVSANNQVYYFPAYELVIDDLRDYRFYAEDMVHPNHAATNYVWEKFIAMCIDEPSQQLMKDVSVINAARLHKPFNPSSHAHQSFLRNHLQKALELKKQHEFLDLKEEIDFFEREIKT